MKLLVDTHAALWWVTGDERLSQRAADLIDDGANEIILSAAVVWEAAIKAALRKLRMPEDFAGTMLAGGVRPLPVSIAHAEAVRDLPHHHGDPFDRLLIAQALAESAVILTRDPVFAAYGVPIAW